MGHEAIVGKLAIAGAKLHEKNKFGSTAIELARLNKHGEVVSILEHALEERVRQRIANPGISRPLQFKRPIRF